MERVFRLGDRRVSGLMTPRIDIAWIDLNDPIDRIHQTILGSARTRFSVCQGTLDDVLGIDYLPDQDSRGYDSLGGLVMHQLGRIPVVTDSFEWEGWCFEVMDMDGRRVDKVLATPLRPSQMNL